MHKCAFCGEEFLNSDEYQAHVMKHYSDKMDEVLSVAKSFGAVDANIERFINSVAREVLEGIIPFLPPQSTTVTVAVPKQPRFSFETIQLAAILLSMPKSVSVDDLFKLLEEIEGKVKQ